MDTDNHILNNKIDIRARQVVREYLGRTGFTSKVVRDTPLDSFSLTNRKFVTANGTTALRPTSSIVGQFYYDTTINRPLWWNGTGWSDAAGGYH